MQGRSATSNLIYDNQLTTVIILAKLENQEYQVSIVVSHYLRLRLFHDVIIHYSQEFIIKATTTPATTTQRQSPITRSSTRTHVVAVAEWV